MKHKCPHCGRMCATWDVDYLASMKGTTELDAQGQTTDIKDAHEQSTDNEELSCVECGGSVEWDGDRLVEW
jgi:hypothetical protein